MVVRYGRLGGSLRLSVAGGLRGFLAGEVTGGRWNPGKLENPLGAGEVVPCCRRPCWASSYYAREVRCFGCSHCDRWLSCKPPRSGTGAFVFYVRTARQRWTGAVRSSAD